MRRLSQAGFKKDFVEPAILPDWWTDHCAEDLQLLTDIEIRVARFLGVSIGAVRDPSVGLTPPEYANAQLRRVRDLDRDRLDPAIHSAIKIAEAVVRSLRDPTLQSISLPLSGLKWRSEISPHSEPVILENLLDDLWTRGIPVVPVDVLPAPNFQGAACVVEGRPVILLGHKYDEPGRVAFLIAHESGHIAAGDCGPDRPVVDEEEEISDDAEIERNADRYATQVLVGSNSVPLIDGQDFKTLARRAAKIESITGADASSIIFAWARRTNEYAAATMAVKALYRGSGGEAATASAFRSLC